MIKKILVALGGSQYMESVIATAISQAKRHGAVLHGVAVVDETLIDHGESVPIGAGDAAREAREKRMEAARRGANEALARFVTTCGEAGVDVTSEVIEGDAVECLRLAWRFQDVGIIGVREAFDYDVVAHDPTHVVRLINEGVRPLIAVDSKTTEMHRVLIAFNGSFESCKSLKQWALTHAQNDVVVRVLTVGDECCDDDLESARAYVEAHDVASADTLRIKGDPDTEILREANAWNADLIVAGSTGRNWLKRMMIGDTARVLVEQTNIALFLLH